MTWHIITGEYPPAIGGVSSYTQLVAEGLAAAGDAVHVWCPVKRKQAAATRTASPCIARSDSYHRPTSREPGDRSIHSLHRGTCSYSGCRTPSAIDR